MENINDLVISGSYVVHITEDIPQVFEALLTEVSENSYKFSSIYSNPASVLDAEASSYGSFWYCTSGASIEDLIASGILPTPSGDEYVVSG